MFWLLMGMAILTGALLQAHLPGIVFFGGIRPPVLCGIVLYYALNHRGSAGVISAFLAGLVLDTLSFVPLGYSVLLYCVMAFVVGRYRKLVLPEAMITAAFFGGLAGLLYPTVIFGLLIREGMAADHLISVIARIVGNGLLGMVTTPVVILIMSRLHKALSLADKEEDGRVNA